MSEGLDRKGKAAILSIGTLLYTDSIVQSALGGISLAFKEIPVETIKLLQTITPLIMMAAALLCGRLVQAFSKKKVLLAGIALILAGGLSPAFYVGSFSYLLVMKAIFSVGYGLCSPLAASILVDTFPPGPVRDSMAGKRQAVGGIASILFSALAGWGAGFHFRWAYAVYFLVVPIFLLIWRCLPDNDVQHRDTRSGGRARMPPAVWGLAGVNVLVNIMLYSFFASVSIVVVRSGAGTSAQAGFTISIFSACVCAAGLLFPVMRTYLKGYLFSFSVLCLALSFVFLSAAQEFSLYIVGSIVFGLGFAIYTPELQLMVAGILAKEHADEIPSASTAAFSLLIVAQSVGQGMSTRILAGLAKLLALDGLKADWNIAAVSLLAIALCAGAAAGLRKKISRLPAPD